MKKAIVFALLIIGFSVICLGPDNFFSNYPYAERTVVDTSTILDEFETGKPIRVTIEFRIQNPDAVFNNIFIIEQEGVEFNMFVKYVFKDLDTDYTIIKVIGQLLIKEPARYWLRFLGIIYTMAGNTEHKYTMSAVHVLVYPPVRFEVSTPVRVICLGYPLLYEAQIITEHELEFEYSQEVVYKQIAKTDYGYLAKLWLSYTEPGSYEAWPMRVTDRQEQYYSPPIPIEVVPFEANLYFSSRAVKVGEPIDFTIEIKSLKEGYEIEQHMSDWGVFKVDNLKIDSDEGYKISGRLKLFEIAGDEYLLGPIGFQYTREEGSGIFYLPAIPIHLQKTVTSDAYVLKGPQYGRNLNMPIWNFVVLGLVFIVVLVVAIKIVKIVRHRKPKKEEDRSHYQKLFADAWMGEDWLAVACLIKQIIGRGMGLTAQESLSLTIEECNADGPALKILEAVDKKLFANEPIDLEIEKYNHNFVYGLDSFFGLP